MIHYILACWSQKEIRIKMTPKRMKCVAKKSPTDKEMKTFAFRTRHMKFVRFSFLFLRQTRRRCLDLGKIMTRPLGFVRKTLIYQPSYDCCERNFAITLQVNREKKISKRMFGDRKIAMIKRVAKQRRLKTSIRHLEG